MIKKLLRYYNHDLGIIEILNFSRQSPYLEFNKVNFSTQSRNLEITEKLNYPPLILIKR